MGKGILRKAVSLVLALALVISLMPTMFASAAEVGDTITLGTSYTLYTAYEDTSSSGGFTGVSTISEKLSNYYSSEEYSRNWKFFRTNWNSTGDQPGFSGSNGLYFRGGIACKGQWFAIKVKGFENGTYSINLHSANRGCIWELYLLDNSLYGTDTITATDITTAIDDMSTGVTKIGERDIYGESATNTVIDSFDNGNKKLSSAATNIDFGSAKLTGGKETEYILLFRAKDYGVLDCDESAPPNGSNVRKSEIYLAMFGLSFTKTADAKNAEIFGNNAAFIEHTDNDAANLYLISAIDSVNYSKVGFMLGEEALETTTVYDSLILPAKSVTDTSGSTTDTTLSYTAADFGLSGKYLYVVKKTLAEGFTGQTINFKPYAVSVDGETTIEGSTYQATLESN